MATDLGYVQYLCEQSGLERELSHRKMFGEYAFYLEGRVVAFACDNQLFLKPTDAGRDLLPGVSEAPPYPGAKLYFRLGEEIDDRDLLKRAFLATARALPLPKPRAPKRVARTAPTTKP